MEDFEGHFKGDFEGFNSLELDPKVLGLVSFFTRCLEQPVLKLQLV